MKIRPTGGLSSKSSALDYTHQSSVRSSAETKDSNAIDLAINSSGTHLAALTVPTSVQLFDTTTLKSIGELTSSSNDADRGESSVTPISSIRFASVSPHLIFAATNKNLVLGWDTRTPGQETLQLHGCADQHRFLSVSCNNEDLLVAAGSELKGDENVVIAFWDLRASSENELLGYYTESHSDDIIHVEFSRLDSSKLLSGSTDGLVCLYDISRSSEEDALEQVYNANGPISKCGYSQHNTVYSITASNDFYIWSSAGENQQLLVRGDTTQQESANGLSSESVNLSTIVHHHLSPTHSTIVDVLTQNDVNEIAPTYTQTGISTWPLFLCDHTGKTSLALVSMEQTSPTMIPLKSPHSEPVRAIVGYRSALFSCGDDGKIVRWQTSASVDKQEAENSSKSKQKFKNRKPY